MEFSAGEVRLLTLEDFQTCRSWKMWNFFGDFAVAVASCIATNELGRAHAVMKQWDRHASHLPIGSIATLYLFGVSLCSQRLAIRRLYTADHVSASRSDGFPAVIFEKTAAQAVVPWFCLPEISRLLH